MPDDDSGGKQQSPAVDPDLATAMGAMAPDAFEPKPAAGQAQDAVTVAALRVHNVALLLAPPTGTSTPGTESATELVALTREFHGALQQLKTRPTMAQNLHINQAIFDLINAGIRLRPDDRLVLDALTADLGALAAARGVTLAAPHPTSQVIETSQDPVARIDATTAAVASLVGGLGGQLDALGNDTSAKESVVAAAAPRLIALLDLLTAPARGLPAGDAKAKHGPSLRELRAQLDALSHVALAHHLDMVGAKLDGIFAAEDAMLVRAGAAPAEHRQHYYAHVNVSDLDDDPFTRDESLPTGGELVNEILSVYQAAPLRQTLALTTLGPLLAEPPPPRDRSLLARMVEAIVMQALTTLSATLASGFVTSVKAIAANPGMLAAAAGEVGGTAADAARAVKGKLPAPAQRGIDAAGRAAKRAGKAVAPAVDFVRETVKPPPELLAGLAAAGKAALALGDVKEHAAGLAKGFQKDVVGAVDGQSTADGAQGPLTFAFLASMGQRIDDYTQSVMKRTPGLRALLETLPPDALTRLRDNQAASLTDAYHAMRTTIAERWTTVVAAAHVGQDPDGTTAHGGTIEDASHLPGVIQLTARLERTTGPMGMTMPKLTHVGKPVLNGISHSMLAVLRESGRPLHLVQMQRTLEVEIPSSAVGGILSTSLIDFGPDGQVDLSRADIAKLTAIARGRIPDHDPGDLEGALGRADHAEATRAARELLGALGLTTKSL